MNIEAIPRSYTVFFTKVFTRVFTKFFTGVNLEVLLGVPHAVDRERA